MSSTVPLHTPCRPKCETLITPSPIPLCKPQTQEAPLTSTCSLPYIPKSNPSATYPLPYIPMSLHTSCICTSVALCHPHLLTRPDQLVWATSNLLLTSLCSQDEENNYYTAHKALHDLSSFPPQRDKSPILFSPCPLST